MSKNVNPQENTMVTQAAPLRTPTDIPIDTPPVSPGMFGAPQPAMPVAGPGLPAPTPAPKDPRKSRAAEAAGNRAAAAPRKRQAAPKKKAAAKRTRARRPARAATVPSTSMVHAPARRGRVASIKLDMETMMDVLGSTKKRDQEALFAIVAALNPLSKPQRIRVMQGVAKLLTA